MVNYHFFWETSSPFSQWHSSAYSLDDDDDNVTTSTGRTINKVANHDGGNDHDGSNDHDGDHADAVYAKTTFTCAEQGMMYGKAMLFGDAETAQRILSAATPRDIKALGRQVTPFDDAVWQQHRWDIVYQHSKAKFTQNPTLYQALMETHPKLLVEASPYDTIWGIGLDAKQAQKIPPTQWRGQNLLGRILTQLRDDLRGGQEAAVVVPVPTTTTAATTDEEKTTQE